MNRDVKSPQPEHKLYFVDEAGDPTIFGSGGKVLVNTAGCSRFFMLGIADVPEPQKLAADLASLRTQLLADPYFKDVPSMQPHADKTALYFHAKDDLPEVRREVFKLLQKHHIRFSAIVRDKLRVLGQVRRRNETDSKYRYNSNELYDFMVRRLFKQRLHTHGHYRICFARRGGSDRTEALTFALEETRSEFARKRQMGTVGDIEVVAASPIREPALQAVDYFLWTLQRAFEKHEDRFLKLLWPQCSLIIDADDTRDKGYGVYYTKRKPLTAAALKIAEGYRSESPK
ncbi:MAG TPA: DUF3800 domain-containing protein [Verrucomicrobiae bacterium]|nr:DUF3800 domain-containing protein [Verrucomicrobiae bacterium]